MIRRHPDQRRGAVRGRAEQDRPTKPANRIRERERTHTRPRHRHGPVPVAHNAADAGRAVRTAGHYYVLAGTRLQVGQAASAAVRMPGTLWKPRQAGRPSGRRPRAARRV